MKGSCTFMFILGLLMSTALYGIFCLLISILGLRIDMSILLQAALHPSGFKGIFLAYMIWSPVAYAVLQVINYIMLKAFYAFTGDDFNFFKDILGRFVSNITNPWRGLVAIKFGSESADEAGLLFWLYCWFEVILHFIWSVALLGFIGFGFFSLIK